MGWQIHVERLFCAGVLVALLGSYWGNVFLAAGQGLVGVAAAFALAGWLFQANERRGNTAHWGPLLRIREIRWSAWFLLAVSVTALVSVLANWATIREPLWVLKKARYGLVWLAPLLLTPLYQAATSGGALRRWAPWWLGGWLLSVASASLSGLIGLWTGFNPLLWGPHPWPCRASGVSGMVLTYAYSVQLSMLLLIVLMLNRNDTVERWFSGKRWLTLFTVVSIVTATGLYFSYARGAMIGMAFGLTAVALTHRSRWVLSGLAVVVVSLSGYALTQHHRYFDVSQLGVESVRVSQWKTALKTLKAYPLFGVGYRQFEERSIELKKRFGYPKDWHDAEFKPMYIKGHAHNDYLEAFASTGVFGGLAYLGFCGMWVWEVSRGKLARRIFLPVVLAFLSSSLVQCAFIDSEVAGFLLLLYFASQVLLDCEKGNCGAERHFEKKVAWESP